MHVEVIPFDFSYWPQFVELSNNHWKENHPIINRELFEWQYTGYGPAAGVENCRLLVVNGKVEGFRGAIPGLYQFKNEYLKGYSSSIWIINRKYRGMGFGNLMLNSIKGDFDVHCSLGVNVNTAGAIYKNKGYAGYDSLNRYVIPLDSKGYTSLLSSKAELEKINLWINSLSLNEYEQPSEMTSGSLENLWNKTIADIGIFGLFKNKDFWSWRYINNVGFKYLFFGNPEKTGVVIARIERVLKENNNHLKVLRIIEVLPLKKETWNYKKNTEMTNLLLKTLSWAKEKGCVAADFQISNSRLTPLMKDTGFMVQSINNMPPQASLAGLFQPFVLKPSPINGVYTITKSNYITMPKVDDTYFVKSDNDMDRTNYWPVIE